MGDFTIEVTEPAALRLQAIAAHIEQLGEKFGHDSSEYLDSVMSWNAVQHNIWRLLAGQGGSLMSDGALSLVVNCATGLYVGVIFFPHHRFDDAQTKPESGSFESTYRATYCQMHRAIALRGNDKCVKTDGDSCHIDVVPVPGTWSLHS